MRRIASDQHAIGAEPVGNPSIAVSRCQVFGLVAHRHIHRVLPNPWHRSLVVGHGVETEVLGVVGKMMNPTSGSANVIVPARADRDASEQS